MVKVPQRDDPVIIAIRKNMEAEKAIEKSRPYLGASEIGQECSRRIWYNYNNYKAKPIEWQGCMAIECGHRSEAVVAGLLRGVDGIELYTEDENGNQYGFSDFDGRFKGHYDGVIKGLPQAPTVFHTWEHKDAGDKKFKEFVAAKLKFGEKDALKNWNYIYYIQAQLYMHYEGLTRHYLTVSLSGVRDLQSCRTEYNKDVAEAHINKAKRIIDAKLPPARISDKPDYYMCRFCPFSEVCHA